MTAGERDRDGPGHRAAAGEDRRDSSAARASGRRHARRGVADTLSAPVPRRCWFTSQVCCVVMFVPTFGRLAELGVVGYNRCDKYRVEASWISSTASR